MNKNNILQKNKIP